MSKSPTRQLSPPLLTAPAPPRNRDSWPTSAVTLASADDMAHSYNATPEADYNWETK